MLSLVHKAAANLVDVWSAEQNGSVGVMLLEHFHILNDPNGITYVTDSTRTYGRTLMPAYTFTDSKPEQVINHIKR